MSDRPNLLPDLKLLILGGGAVVSEYYAPALQSLGWVDNVVVAEPDSAAVERLRSTGLPCIREGFPNCLEKGIESRFDAVIVALPNPLHEAAVEKALKAGLHVLCEKPLALTENGCLRLGEIARKCGKILAVGMTRRLLPSVLALRSALEANLIGPIQNVDVEHGGPYAWLSDSGAFFDPAGGGVLADMGVHYLDLLEDLLGPLRPVGYRDDFCGGVEASCEFRLHSCDGAPVRLALSRTQPLGDVVVFSAPSGELKLKTDVFDGCFWTSLHRPGLHGKLTVRQPFASGDWLPSFHSCFAQQLVEFADCARRQAAPRVSAEDAARTMRLVEWAYAQRRSAERRRPGVEAAGADGRPRLEPAPVVVTGATGFIGGKLVRRLYDLGFSEVTAPIRNYRTCSDLARFSIQLPRLDLLQPDAVRDALKGTRYVFHLAFGRDGANAARITVEGTKNVVNAAIECQAEAVVVFSTAQVFGDPGGEAVDETWPYRPRLGDYGAGKAKMERWCLARSGDSGSTRLIVLNPTCVYGPGGPTFTLLPWRLAREGRFCWVDGGSGIVNYTFVDNVVDAVLLAASRPAAHGKRFIVNDGSCSWRDFLTPILGDMAATVPSLAVDELRNPAGNPRVGIRSLLGHLSRDLRLLELLNRSPVAGKLKRFVLRRSPRLHASLLELQASAGRNQGQAQILKPGPPAPPSWLGDLYGPFRTRFSSRRAKDVLGWRPLVDLKEGQSRALDWLRKRRPA